MPLEPEELAVFSSRSCFSVSLFERFGVPMKEYLAAVLPGLKRWTLSQVSNLNPSSLVWWPGLIFP